MPKLSTDEASDIHPRLLERLAETIAARTGEFQRLQVAAAAHLRDALTHLADLDGLADAAQFTELAARCRAVLATLDELKNSRLPSQAALAAFAAQLTCIAETLMATSAALRNSNAQQGVTQG